MVKSTVAIGPYFATHAQPTWHLLGRNHSYLVVQPLLPLCWENEYLYKPIVILWLRDRSHQADCVSRYVRFCCTESGISIRKCSLALHALRCMCAEQWILQIAQGVLWRIIVVFTALTTDPERFSLTLKSCQSFLDSLPNMWSDDFMN